MRTALLISAVNRPEYAADAGRGLRPMPDFLALAQAIGGPILDRTSAGGLHPVWRRLARSCGPDAGQVLAAFQRRREFDAFLCDSERVGLPLAALLRSVGHPGRVYFIGHRMTARWKQLLWRAAGRQRMVGGVFCYADAQAECLRRIGLPAGRLHRIPFNVDHRFFAPMPGQSTPMVLSVGQERRDYATLVEAARSLDCPVTIVASSPWSRSRAQTPSAGLPANVRFLQNVSFTELRELYARAAVVAVPVQPVDFQAGITSLLEGMAMARPVVATANPGLRDVFADREAGLWVPPGDAPSLALALMHLLTHPRDAEEMGRRGRALVEREMTLDHWVRRICSALSSGEECNSIL